VKAALLRRRRRKKKVVWFFFLKNFSCPEIKFFEFFFSDTIREKKLKKFPVS